MEVEWTKLPLYDSWDFKYTVVLEQVSYVLRLYYSDRTKTWSIDLSLEEGENLVLGESLMPYGNTMGWRVEGLNGFFWLEAIAQDDNETYLHPDLLFKYFNFYYLLPSE